MSVLSSEGRHDAKMFQENKNCCPYWNDNDWVSIQAYYNTQLRRIVYDMDKPNVYWMDNNSRTSHFLASSGEDIQRVRKYRFPLKKIEI